MVIPYQTAKFKSANILERLFGGQLQNLTPANISVYMVLHFQTWYLRTIATLLTSFKVEWYYLQLLAAEE